jgi:hypothetical protein
LITQIKVIRKLLGRDLSKRLREIKMKSKKAHLRKEWDSKGFQVIINFECEYKYNY